MAKLPLIVGFGGINAAGRSSGHHAYRRMVLESLVGEDKEETLLGLAVMMGLLAWHQESSQWQSIEGEIFNSSTKAAEFVMSDVIDGTLVRKISTELFDVDNVPVKTKITLSKGGAEHSFSLAKRRLPNQIPQNWRIEELDDKNVLVMIEGDMDVVIDSSRSIDIKSAGQLPEGFDPSKLYNSRYHPRGLNLAVVAVADAVNSLGVSWKEITNVIAPDDIAVYASSCASQMDDNGFAGVLQARLKGERVSSKQLPLGLNSMPADFVNAYVCGSVGGTGSMSGACATFLYNLKLGSDDIREGRKRVVIVGSSEAPITPEILDGFDAMSALGRASQLEKIDGGETNLRQSSRPFGENCGFTIAESAQYVVLMDDELAVEMGLEIHGAIGDVFVNADGYKKSISSPGIGNYITMSKAVASATAIVGEEAVKQRSFVHSHGSSTPQNRVTESEILNKVADAFDVKNWPVTAVKAYLGHSMGPASGDQLITTLGTFKYGLLPGIKTVKKVAEDVVKDNLSIALDDVDLKDKSDVAFLNSKGFGGNNASAVILSPNIAKEMLKERYGEEAMSGYDKNVGRTRELVRDYDLAFIRGDYRTIYSFGEHVVDESKLLIDRNQITVPGYENPIDLKLKNPYA